MESEQEAARLVEGRESIEAAALMRGVLEWALFNGVDANKLGKLKGVDIEPVSAEQKEFSRLRAELASLEVERDILRKATAACGVC